MEKKLFSALAGILFTSGIMIPGECYSQNQKAVIKNFLTELPKTGQAEIKSLQKYRMTAVYTNRDLYGNFTSKTRVTGEYTTGNAGDSVAWNNVYVSGSQKYEEPFSQGTKQDYMENFRYVPSEKMVYNEDEFSKFPLNPENVFARNLIWDMMTFEINAWNYWDSLKLNSSYLVPDIKGEFNMAGIGTYFHNKVVILWKGISQFNNELCAVIEFSALDNIIEIKMGQIKTKGTEQYWGTIMVSLRTKNIEQAEMYGGTIQEVEVVGIKDKFLVKTIRELTLDKIQ